MRLTLQAAGKTDVGLVRKNNEDNFGYDVRQGIFVVCDGMGGQNAGEVASKIAVDTMLAAFSPDQKNTGVQVLGRNFEAVSARANALASAMQLANKAILEASAATAERSGMGCTIVAASAEGDLFSIAHVGDSRIYLVRNNTIQLLTMDHSLVMEHVRRGMMTTEEAATCKMQNVIVRALGSEETVEPDLADLAFEDGDTLLLCCDGLSRFVKEEDMLAVLSKSENLDDACSQLIEAAKAGSSDDNITCVLVRASARSWGGRMFDKLTSGSEQARHSSS